MQPNEIQEIGRQLRVRGKITQLLEVMRAKRPTLSRDTIYRAFFREPERKTELLEEIRATAQDILEGEKAAKAA